MNTLAERAVLMRLAISLPGENRQDAELTTKVKAEQGLGSHSGKWVKQLYPTEALRALKQLDTEARDFHNNVTLPFDTGIGILPAALIQTYTDKLREFKSRREVLREEFLANPERWIDWAVVEHNGTFDASQYPGCFPADVATTGKSYRLDVQEFQTEMRKRFDFQINPLPIPNSEHFCSTVSSLLGADVESVDLRIKDAAIEAQRALLKRMLIPVSKMAAKLAEEPKLRKNGKMAKDISFKDSLTENLQEIADIAPALNLGCDPQIDAFIAEIEALAKTPAESLRDDKVVRSQVQQKADDLMKRLSGYAL